MFNQTGSIVNSSAMEEYKKELNIYANVRDYLIGFTKDLVIGTLNSIILQSSSLSQITQSTNQLTRNSSVSQQSFLLLHFFFSS